MRPHEPIDADRVTLAILAGGEGSRMGKPKGALTIGHEPILRYLLRQIAWTGPTLLITAPGRQHPLGWEQFGAEVTDPQPGGPLRGILTGLENVRTPLLAVLTVDMPMIKGEHVRWLIESCEARPDLMGLMSRRTMEIAEQVEPFPSVYRAEASAVIAAELQAKRRSVHGLLNRRDFEAITVPPHWNSTIWTNLNSPADVKAFENRGQF